MAADLSLLSDASTKVAALGNLILVSPQKTVGYQPQKYPSFVKDTSTPDEAFIFDFEDEQAVTLTSDITDHFTEENSAVNDNIALKPVTIQTKGFIAELNNVVPPALKPLKVVADKLTVVDAFMPQLSVTALQAFNDATLAYSIAKNAATSAMKAIDTLAGQDGANVINGTGVTKAKDRDQTKQQIAFNKFYAFWQNKTLFTVQTPWAIFQDMAILSIHSVQSGDSDKVSEFDVTFKMMRFATTQELDKQGNVVSPDAAQGRASSQAAVEQDLGTQSLSESLQTFNPGAA